MNHPICAQITPPGTAAISVIRISGREAIEIVAEYFSPKDKLLSSKGHTCVYGTFCDADQIPLDEVLCTVFRSPASYTGEDTVELSCHGNPYLSDRILQVLLQKAQLAKPGEFTLRAYLNGKMDLVQAEAVNDIIMASTSKAESAALMQRQGYLSRHLQLLLSRITDARVRCELAIDFSDQDLPQIDLEDLEQRISSLIADAKILHDEGSNSIVLREGIKICLAGAPNAGKSSLFNAFLKHNRAIVTPHPGTTRDYLEESFSLNGFPIVLYDTAGIRESDDSIEQEGIARSLDLMIASDLILYLYDNPSELLYLATEMENYKHKTIFVSTKADTKDSPPMMDHVSCSVILEDGLTAVTDAIMNRLKLPQDIMYRPLITNARHLSALSRAIDALEKAMLALTNDLGFEYIAFDLIAASAALEDILGIISSEDLLNSIFNDFCIGK